jgi:hypothetical protein
MRSQVILGAVLFVVGLVLLYLLRALLFELIIFVIGFVGLIVAFAFVFGGLALIFWSRRDW